MLVYKSEDIKNVSRLQSPKVCGYLKVDNEELLPKGLVAREPSNGKSLKNTFQVRNKYVTASPKSVFFLIKR